MTENQNPVFNQDDMPYISVLPDNSYEIYLPAPLKQIIKEQIELLTNELNTEGELHPNLVRLNPPASFNDIEKAIEFSSLYNFSIRNSHLMNLQSLSELDNKAYINTDELVSIAKALNALRLYFGAELGIDNETDNNLLLSSSGTYYLYLLFGYLLEEIISILSGQY